MKAVNKQALPNQFGKTVNKQGKPRAHDIILNLASNLFHLFPVVVVVVLILCHARVQSVTKRRKLGKQNSFARVRTSPDRKLKTTIYTDRSICFLSLSSNI